VVVLYVDEGTSISRQLMRAVSAQAHNRRAKDAGVGDHQLQEERSTDVKPDKAAKRYQIFR
jgi:adenylate kinase